MHEVLEVLAQRAATRSQPGQREDSHRLVIALEGGSSRAAYGGGMVAALEERGLLHVFDAVYGVSAGALNGAWLTCQRSREYLHGWWVPESMKGTIKFGNVLRGKPVVDGDFIVDTLYESVTLMGFEEVLASPVEYHPIATDALTGQSVDLYPFIKDRQSLKAAMKATIRIPLLSGQPVDFAGRRFLDGGLAENVPVETALDQGATHVLVVRTKAPSLELSVEHPVKQKLVGAWLSKYAPGAVGPWQDRPRMKRDLEALMAEHPRVFQVAPPADAPRISMTDSHEEVQKQAVMMGRSIMRDLLDSVLGER